MVYLVPLLCFVLPLILGVILVRRQFGKAIPVLLVIGAGAIYWAFAQGQQQPGLDGIGYAIFAMLIVVPAMAGLFIGGIVAWARRDWPKE